MCERKVKGKPQGKLVRGRKAKTKNPNQNKNKKKRIVYEQSGDINST